MKYEKYKKIIVAILLILVIVPIFENVNAAINMDYYNTIKKTSTVSSSLLSSILGSDILIDPLAKLIYSIGNFMEYIVGAVVLAASGSNIFPWADAIVFNAIPMLDVNFISPDTGSIIFNIQGVIKSIYASLFSLAEIFFGIAVFLMAIKLAISAIAAEKAKYKDALVKWLIGLVLLFGMQFFISFIFYLNEQLVIVASNIASDELSNSGFIAQMDEATNNIGDEVLVKNFTESVTDKGVIDWLESITSFGLYDLGEYFIDKTHAYYTGTMDKDEAVNYLNGNAKITSALLKDVDYREASGLNSGFVAGKKNQFWTWQVQANGRAFLKLTAATVKTIAVSELDELEESYRNAAAAYNRDASDKNKDIMIICKSMYNAKAYSENKTDNNKKTIITGLASYFKTAAWAYEDGGWKPTKAILENAILYAILVIQSVTLLISYIKRLFYIIVLALTAPIVVVFDFLKKI